MRLIDADKLKVLIAIENDGQMNTGKLITELFNGIEAVEAIPIEWIVKYMASIDSETKYAEQRIIQYMLEEWKKENEIN